ncbi:hypothetical protein ACVWZT_000276 [Pseudomonas sp. TE21394]
MATGSWYAVNEAAWKIRALAKKKPHAGEGSAVFPDK